MKGSIEEVPLVCIKIIDKIIAKLYQGRSFSWLQFLGAVNDKKTVKNREALVSVVDKWLVRRSATSKDENGCY